MSRSRRSAARSTCEAPRVGADVAEAGWGPTSPAGPPESVVDVLAAVAGAAEADVTLSDDKGRKVFIPAGSLAYVEVGEASPRRVGFGV